MKHLKPTDKVRLICPHCSKEENAGCGCDVRHLPFTVTAQELADAGGFVLCEFCETKCVPYTFKMWEESVAHLCWQSQGFDPMDVTTTRNLHDLYDRGLSVGHSYNILTKQAERIFGYWTITSIPA